MKTNKDYGMKTTQRLQKLSLCAFSFGLLTCVLTCVLACAGCSRLNRPPTAEEEAMVRETLDVTSPRAENNQPKAIPEFKFTWGGSKRRSPAPYPTEEDIVTDRDIRLENN